MTPATVLRLATALLTVALAIAPAAYAQVLYGSMTGKVTDSTGGALPGTNVQAVNVGTGVTKATVTDPRGGFIFSDLIPGVYDVSFELTGFKNVVQKGVRVDSNSVRRMDVPLEVSAVQESIDVSAAALAIQTDRADVHITQTRGGQRAAAVGQPRAQLPEPDAGGARRRDRAHRERPGRGQLGGRQPAARDLVQRERRLGLAEPDEIDGSPVQYAWLPTNTSYVPSAEAIEEVSIVTNSYTAERGHGRRGRDQRRRQVGDERLPGHGLGLRHRRALRGHATSSRRRPATRKNIVTQYGGNLAAPSSRTSCSSSQRREARRSAWPRGAACSPSRPRTCGPTRRETCASRLPSQGGAIIYDPSLQPRSFAADAVSEQHHPGATASTRRRCT